ncbi:hypothetical protein WJX79_003263 [Trebouxia sp. C0005]
MPALVLHNGLLVCEACGTQAEGFVEETAEFQNMLQAQLEALVSNFGVQSSSLDAALPIWTAILAQSGILNEFHLQQLAARIQGNQDDNGDKDSKHIKRSFKAELRDALTVLLPPRTLLVVCLLVCWLGREAVSHVDLIRGAMLGHVPFLDMPVRCKDLLQTPAGHGLPVSAMKSATAYGLLNAQTLLNKAAEMAADLELKLPPLNAPLVFQRTILELAMPQALIAPALALFRCYREGTIYMRLFETDNRTWTSPYIYTMAVLIVTIKVLYGLDGIPRPAPLGLPGAPQWAQWAESALQHLQGPVYPEAHEQVSGMTNVELLQYKRYLQKYVFAGWEAPDDLKEWVRLLERHILHADMQAEEEEETMTDGDDNVGHPTANGGPKQPAPSAVDEDRRPVPTEEAKHPYLFTGQTRSKLTRDKVAPDYAAVLTVCSRYLWVTPIQLHAEVAQLEYEMAEVEASASSN